MKRNTTPQRDSRPPNRPDPIAAARKKAHATERKQEAKRRNLATMGLAVLIGGIAILAVFAGLETLSRDSEKQAAAAAAAAEAAAAKAQPATPATPLAGQTKPSPKPTAPAKPADIGPSPATPATTASVPDTPKPVTPAPEATPAPDPLLVLAGPDANREQTTSRDRDLLQRTIDDQSWNRYRELLADSIRAAVPTLSRARGLNQFDPLWNEPVLYQALLRWNILCWFSESQISSRITDSYSGAMFIWLLNDSPAMEELLVTIRPEDDGGSILDFLNSAWKIDVDLFKKYRNLAIASAVVFDQTIGIPHPVGSDSYGSETTVDGLKRYEWYIKKNEGGKLAAPVHRSSAPDLVWVVCAPVTTSELEWAISNVHYSRKKWGNAYGKIVYLMERAVEGLNPYEEYSFAEILKEGGICGDQSYFCVNTARAQGIPAMTISGETDLGGHAWAGVKITSREWTTAVGRVGGASKGQAGNPQTGKPVSEQEIQLWNDRLHQSDVTSLTVWRHLWASRYFTDTNDTENASASIRLANRIGHSFPETWQALHALLEKETRLEGSPPEPNNLEEWQAFASDMRREFRENPRMAGLAAKAEIEHIFPYCEEGEARRILMRERRRIDRDSGEQTDLIAASLSREASLLIKRGSPDAKRDVMQLYDRALREYGGSIPGFKAMAADYFSHFRNDPELARKATRDIELAFKRVVETGTKDWFRANTESSIYRMICEYYRVAGDPKRAELLEKRYQVLLRRAKRSAL